MNLDKINSLVDSRVNEIFSSNKFYDGVRKEGLDKYNKYLAKHDEKTSLTTLIVFEDENVLKNAITIAMKETVKLLADNGLLQARD